MAYVAFDELKSRLKIEDVAKMLQLTTKEHNGQLRSACPRCKTGGDRALVITPAKSAFFCFAEKKGGDLISLAAHILDVSARDAAVAIDKHFGGNHGSGAGTVQARTSTVPATPPANAPREPLRPLDYLEPAHELALGLGVSEATSKAFGAGYAPKGIMRGRYAIPLHDRRGTLVAYCGRATKGESPTLIFPNGFQPDSLIFNAHQVTAGELYLVRDPLAVLTAFESGVENVVAFLTEGIGAIQFEQLASLMDEKSCDTCILF